MKLSVMLLSMLSFLLVISSGAEAGSSIKQKGSGGFANFLNSVRKDVQAQIGKTNYSYGKRMPLSVNQRSIYEDDQLERTMEAICLKLALV